MFRPLAVCCLAFAAGQAFAQSCANPININVNTGPFSNTYTGSYNSCYSQDNLTYLDHASLYTPGRDIVYHVSPTRQNVRFTLVPQPGYDAAIFACSQCGALASCIDVDDAAGPGSPESMRILAQANGFYFIVDSTDPNPGTNCGSYTLYTAIVR